MTEETLKKSSNFVYLHALFLQVQSQFYVVNYLLACYLLTLSAKYQHMNTLLMIDNRRV